MTIKQAIIEGLDIDKWHKDQMRKNNIFWFLVLILCLVLWTGHVSIVFDREEKVYKDLQSKAALVDYQQRQIDTLQQAVDSAVYFNEIINGSHKH